VFFRLYQPGFSQDGHVVRNSGLRERNVVLYIASAHAHAFPDGALALLFQEPKYFHPRRVGHRFERQHELFIGHWHRSFISTAKIDFGQYEIVY
jgi:hypothetical protein